MFGLDKLTSAFGIKLLFMGFAALVGSPIAGRRPVDATVKVVKVHWPT
jgi:hypothetical protein